MNRNTIEILEYKKIKEKLRSFALSEQAKEMAERLEAHTDINQIERFLRETTEARAVVNITSSIPIHSLNGIKKIKGDIEKGAVLSSEELGLLSDFLREGKRLKEFFKGKEYAAPNISNYALSISELEPVREEIDRCIHRGSVDDRASGTLLKIRKRISIVEDRIKSKLDSYLKNGIYKDYIRDNVISQRNGRYVISVKSEHKRNVDGFVHDVSGSGSTAFIEPAEVKKLQDELNTLRIDEEREVYKILAALTAYAAENIREISINMETMVYYDFIFAKGKLSKSMDGRNVFINTNNYINIKNGKHPLLGNDAVPLDFVIGKDYKSLVITGPNTGGKTVVLKTVGLLTMMVQSGLHVPVEEGSEFAVFINILADIGDGQSIEQNLSTFSSHIKNIIGILANADEKTLVILDEIGAGTDPGEGMGIGIAVLEFLYEKGAITLASTHYSEIKDFAQNNKGFINGCMDFDVKTLKPLYRLSIGKAGESNAFLIALRLGMKADLIERAHRITYKESKKYTFFHEEYKELINRREVEKEQNQGIEKLNRNEEREIITRKKKTEAKFKIGDSVYISTMNRTGIVCELENSRGEVGVMVMKNRFKINHKRLSLYIEGEELYPPDYDFDIIFESKENRKAKKKVNKGYTTGVRIEYDRDK